MNSLFLALVISALPITNTPPVVELENFRDIRTEIQIPQAESFNILDQIEKDMLNYNATERSI